MRAVCRVAKVKGAGSIAGKTEHNYRTGHVPNADPALLYLNQEYVLAEANLGKAIENRLLDADITKTRQDAVKAMEFILTASPEAFPRGENGEFTADYRESEWVTANLEFMQQQYGPNLVAFTLHQDEKTPHIHAMVVPVTADHRLCAKELFNPKTLRQLQTDYAKAMEPFGLERGVEGSRAQHVPMKRIYGIQQAQRQQIEEILTPLEEPAQTVQIDKPTALDFLNIDRWRQEQAAKINAQHAEQIAKLKEAAKKAVEVAVANATAHEKTKVLQQRLDTSEELKQSNHEKATELGGKLENVSNRYEALTVVTDEKRYHIENVNKRANEIRARVTPKIEDALLATIREMKNEDDFGPLMEKKGYKSELDKEGYIVAFRDPKTAVRVETPGYRIGGQLLRDLYDNRVTQLAQAEKQRKAAADKTKETPTPKQAPQQPTPGQRGKEEPPVKKAPVTTPAKTAETKPQPDQKPKPGVRHKR
jgi:hypothetical protein